MIVKINRINKRIILGQELTDCTKKSTLKEKTVSEKINEQMYVDV